MRPWRRQFWVAFIIAVFLILAGMLWWSVENSITNFKHYHDDISFHTVNSASSEVELLLSGLRTSLRLFADENSALIQQIAMDPENEETQRLLSRKLANYFPLYHAVSIADSSGSLITDDFGEKVGPLCRQDIVKYATNGNKQHAVIHPGPAAYHFDIVVNWHNGSTEGIFFVSFYPELLTDILSRTQIPGHKLYLTHSQQERLIEMDSRGSRDLFGGDNFIPEEMWQSLVHKKAIGLSDWVAVDFTQPDILADYRTQLMQQVSWILFGIGITLLGFMLLLLKIEKERANSQRELQLVNQQLEVKVAERTQSFTDSNNRLRIALNNQENENKIRKSLQSVLRQLVLNASHIENLHLLGRTFEQWIGNTTCFIYSYVDDKQLLNLVTAPSASTQLQALLQEIPVREDGFPSGRSAFHKQQLYVHDLSKEKCDPDLIQLVQQQGGRSLLSQPLLSDQNQLIGVFCVLFRGSFELEKREQELLRLTADFASIVLQRYRKNQQLEQVTEAIEQTADAVVITDREGVITYVNRAFSSMSGYSKQEVLGHTNNIVKSGKQSDEFYQLMWRTLFSGNVFSNIFINKHKNGTLYYEEKTISPLFDENGEIIRFIGTGKNITDRIEMERHLTQLAHFDELTKLPNRVKLLDELANYLKSASRDNTFCAVHFIDLDKFKSINDTLGHPIGDALLIAVSDRLKELSANKLFLARNGGDEFIIVQPAIMHENSALQCAEKIVKRLAEPFWLHQHEIHIGATIGISIFPKHGGTALELLRCADTAMYQIKKQGCRNITTYDPVMSAKIEKRLEYEKLLRSALEKNEFFLVYQPQINSTDNNVVGFEALLRWKSTQYGIVSPVEFIPVLEETGLIYAVGKWIIEEVIHFIASGANRGAVVSLNLSPLQCAHTNLVDIIHSFIEKYQINPALLELEMTESLLVDNFELTSKIFTDLQQLGVKIALDDFGTGYTSMNYLTRLPFNVIKLDRSFVVQMEKDENVCKVISAIFTLAHSLDKETVTEGIETEEQLALIRKFGGNIIQGYFYSKPLPQTELQSWLDNR